LQEKNTILQSMKTKELELREKETMARANKAREEKSRLLTKTMEDTQQ
jgi:hypothetical protein